VPGVEFFRIAASGGRIEVLATIELFDSKAAYVSC